MRVFKLSLYFTALLTYIQDVNSRKAADYGDKRPSQ
jgi:hypothetical protein